MGTVLILLGTFGAFLVINVPVAFSMTLACILALLWQGVIPVSTVALKLYSGIDTFPFLAIPLLELFPGACLPGSGLRIEEVAGQMSGEGMKALDDYTEYLREEIGYDSKRRESRASGQGAAGRNR